MGNLWRYIYDSTIYEQSNFDEHQKKFLIKSINDKEPFWEDASNLKEVTLKDIMLKKE